VAVAAAAQEQEGTEAMDIAIAVACKGAPERCENEGFSGKPTRSCSLLLEYNGRVPKESLVPQRWSLSNHPRNPRN